MKSNKRRHSMSRILISIHECTGKHTQTSTYTNRSLNRKANIFTMLSRKEFPNKPQKAKAVYLRTNIPNSFK